MRKINTLYYGLAYIGMLSCLLACISGSQYLLTGSLTDIWIPLLSAKAMADGIALYVDWHSPLGIIYHQLHYGAYLLIQAYPGVLHQLDQLLLASVGFSGFLVGIFMLCYSGFSVTNALPNWILLLSISTACQLRAINQLFSPFALLWSGAYNNQGWALLLLVCALITSWQQYSYAERLKYTKARFVIGLAVATTIGLHFKISIGVSLLLWSILALAENRRWLSHYLLASGCLQMALHLSYGPLWHYWYDIVFVIIHAQPHGPSTLTKLFCLLVSIITLSYLTLSPTTPSWQDRITVSYLSQRWQALCRIPANIIAQKIVFAVGLLIAIQGESQATLSYYGLVLGLCCALDKRYRYRARLAKIFLGVFFLCNMISLITLASYKHFSPEKGIVHIPLDSVQHTGGFLVDSARGLSHIHAYLAQAAISYDPMRVAVSPHTQYLAFHNLDYAKMIQQASSAIAQVSHNPEDTVVMLGFTNPLPILLHRPLPLPSWHWLDFAVNLSPQHLDMLIPLYQQTDFLYLPLVAFDDSGDPGYQRVFTTHFMAWNRTHHRFTLIAKQPLGLLYAKQTSPNIAQS